MSSEFAILAVSPAMKYVGIYFTWIILLRQNLVFKIVRRRIYGSQVNPLVKFVRDGPIRYP